MKNNERLHLLIAKAEIAPYTYLSVLPWVAKMGCTASSSREDKVNEKINSEQRMAIRREYQVVKLLVVVAGDKRRNTLLKDIRRISAEQLPKKTRASYGPNVIRSLIQGMIHILEALPKLGINLPETLKNHAASITGFERPYPPVLSSNIANNLSRLISSPPIKEALSRQSEFHLDDCWPYLAQQLLETPGWGREGWIPSIEEFTRVRICTLGIIEDTLTIDGHELRMIDVNRQRGDKRKYTQMMFTYAVDAVLFVTDVSEYDQRVDEDRNRFEEALSLFSEICHCPLFKKTTILLYLDQVDQFRQKFSEQTIPSNFSDALISRSYEDPKTATVGWFESQFYKRVETIEPIFRLVKLRGDTTNAWENIRAIYDRLYEPMHVCIFD